MAKELGANEKKGSQEEWSQFLAIRPDIAVGSLPAHWFAELAELTRAKLTDDTAPEAAMRAVHEKNRDTFWGIFRKDGETHTLAGYFAFLLLNTAGHRQLRGGTLALKHPPIESVAAYGERPEAVYIWGVIAEGLMALAHPAIVGEVSRKYGGLRNYTTPATEGGLKVTKKLGFVPIAPEHDRIGGLFYTEPHGIPVLQSRFQVRTVTGPEDLQRVFAIRSAVYIAEQRCPYEEEFDGNDYCATHLLGLVGGEPAATIRIRYFNDWVKLERMAVLPKFRHTLITGEIIHLAFEIARRKGYRRCYGQAQMRLLPFWKRYGFGVYPTNRTVAFSDHDYVEVYRELAAHPDPVTMRSDPMVMIRPEGQWDQSGVLDRSAQRPVTRPL
jgi:predicted GNAT family N-acyltransferase